MAVPSGFHVRVIRMYHDAPYDVKVHLPNVKGPPVDTQFRTIGPELDIIISNNDDHHVQLGRFLSQWSLLEQSLAHLFRILMMSDYESAQIILSVLSMKQKIELLNGLAALKLPKTQAERLENFTDRVGRLNTKRNVLVHGTWVLEACIYIRKGDAVLDTQFLRELAPPHPAIAALISDPKIRKYE